MKELVILFEVKFFSNKTMHIFLFEIGSFSSFFQIIICRWKALFCNIFFEFQAANLNKLILNDNY